MKKIIIGLMGYSGSGKSTLSARMCEEISLSEVVSFADPLKEKTCYLFDLLPNFHFRADQKDLVLDEYGKTPRDLAKLVGDLVRGVDADYFIKVMSEVIWDSYSSSQIYIIDDVRLEREAAFIKGSGGILVRLEGGIPGTHLTDTDCNAIQPDYRLNSRAGEEVSLFIDWLKGRVYNE